MLPSTQITCTARHPKRSTYASTSMMALWRCLAVTRDREGAVFWRISWRGSRRRGRRLGNLGKCVVCPMVLRIGSRSCVSQIQRGREKPPPLHVLSSSVARLLQTQVGKALACHNSEEGNCFPLRFLSRSDNSGRHLHNVFRRLIVEPIGEEDVETSKMQFSPIKRPCLTRARNTTLYKLHRIAPWNSHARTMQSAFSSLPRHTLVRMVRFTSSMVRRMSPPRLPSTLSLRLGSEAPISHQCFHPTSPSPVSVQ